MTLSVFPRLLNSTDASTIGGCFFFRFKVLKHHPDKRRAAGEDIREDDDYFTCITKVTTVRSSMQLRSSSMQLFLFSLL